MWNSSVNLWNTLSTNVGPFRFQPLFAGPHSAFNRNKSFAFLFTFLHRQEYRAGRWNCWGSEIRGEPRSGQGPGVMGGYNSLLCVRKILCKRNQTKAEKPLFRQCAVKCVNHVTDPLSGKAWAMKTRRELVSHSRMMASSGQWPTCTQSASSRFGGVVCYDMHANRKLRQTSTAKKSARCGLGHDSFVTKSTQTSEKENKSVLISIAGCPTTISFRIYTCLTLFIWDPRPSPD